MSSLKSATTTPLEHRLATPPRFNAAPLFGFMAGRAFAGVETVRADRYTRAFTLGGAAGTVCAEARAGRREMIITIDTRRAASVPAVLERLAHVFDLDAPSRAVAARLGADPVLAKLIQARPSVRIPGAWDPFELAVRAILGQQITVKAASTLAARIIARHGRPLAAALARTSGHANGLTHHFPTRAALACADLPALGVIRARTRAIQSLAAAAIDPALFRAGRPLDAFVAELVRLPGIGPWTAQYVALRGLGEADAFPGGDLGLVRGYSRLAGRDTTIRELDRIAQRWRPYRGYAAMLLWTAP